MFYTGDSNPSRRTSSITQLGGKASAGQGNVAIVLERNNGPYNAGEVLRGHVIIDIAKDIKIKGIKLLFTGAARVSWDEKRAYTKGSAPSVAMKNCEILLEHTIQVLKKEKTLQVPHPGGRKRSIFACGGTGEDDDITVSAGSNKYPFEFMLPKHLPSSFDGRWGSIQYGVKMSFERMDLDRFIIFTVRGHYDFNDDLDILRPIAGRETFTVSNLCCGSGTLKVNIGVAKKGFTLGENVPFMVEITNSTKQKMRNCKVSLIQHIIFRAAPKMKRSTVVLKSFPGGAIPAGETKTWRDEVLTIPGDALPTFVRDLKAIQLKYTLSVIIEPGGWADDYNIPVNLIIGTVPVRPVLAQRYLAKMGLADSSLQDLNDLLSRHESQNSRSASRQNSNRDSLAIPQEEMSGSRRCSTSSNGMPATSQTVTSSQCKAKKKTSTSQGLTVAEARSLQRSISDISEN